MYLKSVSAYLRLEGNLRDEDLVNDFAKRYIPEISIDKGKEKAVVDWKMSKNPWVSIEEFFFGDVDRFRISSAPPAPYKNENPYFFILQVFSRLYEKEGMLLINDCVVFSDSRKGALVIGAPHTGKSTLMALAIHNGFTPLANENAVFEVKNGELLFKGGATMFTFSKMALERYKIKVEADKETKHGYGMLNLEKFNRKPAKISGIFYSHSSFSSHGFDMEEISGRKIKKLLWYHANRVISGGEHYEKHPINMSTPDLDSFRAEKVGEVAEFYAGKFFEVFGAHDRIFEKITEML